jgi:hypothetical protein
VNDSAGDSASELGLCHFESFGGILLFARRDCRLHLLDEGPDSADSRMVDVAAVCVPLDALLGLRGVRIDFLFFSNKKRR